MEKTPRLTAWELYFKTDDGYENRDTVAKAFAAFWNSSDYRLDIPGTCMLGGKVYDRKGFNDGDEILTSRVIIIQRIMHSSHNGTLRDLMRAATESGSVYYFYSDDANAYMSLMLGDIAHTGSLNSQPDIYLPPLLRHRGLI